MRRIARWVYGASSVYHSVVGALALLAPTLAIVLHGGSAAEAGDPYMRAMYRGMGTFMVFTGLVSGLVAKDPDASPLLVAFLGVLSGLTLAGWGLAMAAGDVTFGQVSTDVLLQLPVLVVSALYYPVARRRTMDVLELLMTGDLRDQLRRERLGEGAYEAPPVRRREGERVARD